MGGLFYDWGAVGATTTTQLLDVGGQTTVTGLPAGVTVSTVTYTFWLENRVGQTSYGPGAFWVGNAKSNRANQDKAAMPWTPTAGSAWLNTVSNTSNLVSKVYPDGVTRQAWDLNMTWKSGTNGSTGTYTTGTNGCRTFTTGPSGRFAITYTDVPGLPNCPNPNAIVHQFVTVTVTLSNGTVLTKDILSDGGTKC